MSVDIVAVRGEVVSKVAEQFGPEMAQYVEQSMAVDPHSPFARMISDAMLAKQHLADGEMDKARTIIETYRQMAEAAGFEALFDIMLESMGISMEPPCQIDESAGRAEGQYSPGLTRAD